MEKLRWAAFKKTINGLDFSDEAADPKVVIPLKHRLLKIGRVMLATRRKHEEQEEEWWRLMKRGGLGSAGGGAELSILSSFGALASQQHLHLSGGGETFLGREHGPADAKLAANTELLAPLASFDGGGLSGGLAGAAAPPAAMGGRGAGAAASVLVFGVGGAPAAAAAASGTNAIVLGAPLVDHLLDDVQNAALGLMREKQANLINALATTASTQAGGGVASRSTTSIDARRASRGGGNANADADADELEHDAEADVLAPEEVSEVDQAHIVTYRDVRAVRDRQMAEENARKEAAELDALDEEGDDEVDERSFFYEDVAPDTRAERHQDEGSCAGGNHHTGRSEDTAPLPGAESSTLTYKEVKDRYGVVHLDASGQIYVPPKNAKAYRKYRKSQSRLQLSVVPQEVVTSVANSALHEQLVARARVEHALHKQLQNKAAKNKAAVLMLPPEKEEVTAASGEQSGSSEVELREAEERRRAEDLADIVVEQIQQLLKLKRKKQKEQADAANASPQGPESTKSAVEPAQQTEERPRLTTVLDLHFPVHQNAPHTDTAQEGRGGQQHPRHDDHNSAFISSTTTAPHQQPLQQEVKFYVHSFPLVMRPESAWHHRANTRHAFLTDESGQVVLEKRLPGLSSKEADLAQFLQDIFKPPQPVTTVKLSANVVVELGGGGLLEGHGAAAEPGAATGQSKTSGEDPVPEEDEEDAQKSPSSTATVLKESERNHRRNTMEPASSFTPATPKGKSTAHLTQSKLPVLADELLSRMTKASEKLRGEPSTITILGVVQGDFPHQSKLAAAGPHSESCSSRIHVRGWVSQQAPAATSEDQTSAANLTHYYFDAATKTVLDGRYRVEISDWQVPNCFRTVKLYPLLLDPGQMSGGARASTTGSPSEMFSYFFGPRGGRDGTSADSAQMEQDQEVGVAPPPHADHFELDADSELASSSARYSNSSHDHVDASSASAYGFSLSLLWMAASVRYDISDDTWLVLVKAPFYRHLPRGRAGVDDAFFPRYFDMRATARATTASADAGVVTTIHRRIPINWSVRFPDRGFAKLHARNLTVAHPWDDLRVQSGGGRAAAVDVEKQVLLEQTVDQILRDGGLALPKRFLPVPAGAGIKPTSNVGRYFKLRKSEHWGDVLARVAMRPGRSKLPLFQKHEKSSETEAPTCRSLSFCPAAAPPADASLDEKGALQYKRKVEETNIGGVYSRTRQGQQPQSVLGVVLADAVAVVDQDEVEEQRHQVDHARPVFSDDEGAFSASEFREFLAFEIDDNVELAHEDDASSTATPSTSAVDAVMDDEEQGEEDRPPAVPRSRRQAKIEALLDDLENNRLDHLRDPAEAFDVVSAEWEADRALFSTEEDLRGRAPPAFAPEDDADMIDPRYGAELRLEGFYNHDLSTVEIPGPLSTVTLQAQAEGAPAAKSGGSTSRSKEPLQQQEAGPATNPPPARDPLLQRRRHSELPAAAPSASSSGTVTVTRSRSPQVENKRELEQYAERQRQLREIIREKNALKHDHINRRKNYKHLQQEVLHVNSPYWDGLAEQVREHFLVTWTAYKVHAWGSDEWCPVTRQGTNSTFGGIGMQILDVLSALIIFDLPDELEVARRFVAQLDFSQASKEVEVSVFELMIRAVGGLLSAYAMLEDMDRRARARGSTTSREQEVPAADPRPSHHPRNIKTRNNSTAEQVLLPPRPHDVFLQKAEQLVQQIIDVFRTPSSLPFSRVRIGSGLAVVDEEQPTVLSEVATMQLELRYLSHATKNQTYALIADSISHQLHFDVAGDLNGGYTFWQFSNAAKTPVRVLASSRYSLGGQGDSYYEYLLKQFLQDGTDLWSLQVWKKMLGAILDEETGLVTRKNEKQNYYIVEREILNNTIVNNQMAHLACFFPGLLALHLEYVKDVGNGADVDGDAPAGAGEKSFSSGRTTKASKVYRDREFLHTIKESTMQNCFDFYRLSPTGLAPEAIVLPLSEGVEEEEEEASRLLIPPGLGYSLLRPETVESLYYLDYFEMRKIENERDGASRTSEAHQAEPDEAALLLPEDSATARARQRKELHPLRFKQMGHFIWEALREQAFLPGLGFCTVPDVTQFPNVARSCPMHTFVLGETLVYLYMLFRDHSTGPLLNLNEWVFNTEAHPLPRMEAEDARWEDARSADRSSSVDRTQPRRDREEL
eukprot:g10321.t1